MAKLYENVFKGKYGVLYARTYNTELDISELNQVKYIPSLYIPTKESSQYKSIVTKENLKKITFKDIKEYRETVKMYESGNITLYGNKSQEFGYIQENFGKPTANDHNFRTLYLDIETAILDEDTPSEITKNDWKPQGERAAMATITSIQMYDTKNKEFYILGLKRDWKNETNFKSKIGNVRYIKCESEENLLKTFIKILTKINPTVIAGWNSTGYDYPYITMRILRVLDGKKDIYVYDKNKKIWRFNRANLDSPYVSQLSPVGLIEHKAVETNYGTQDTFQWIGYFLEDYLELYKKYADAKLTSYSLSSVSGHELGDDKVNHDEFADFAEFYRKDFDTFIVYGIKDVELLYNLDEKLKLIDLAKYLAYTCGVTMNDVKGTVKQWVSFMFNECYQNKEILPIKNFFNSIDTVLLEYAVSEQYKGPRKEEYKRLLSNEETHGQKFIGGWVRGTGKFWKWVFSLDFTSLYPSAQMWANIGIDTLIEPKNLHPELLELRAKYFIYYDKSIEAKKIEELDYRFIREVLNNEKVRNEINEVLTRHNVSATPNGMFFSRKRRSAMSIIIERLIVDRKKYKKLMKTTEQEIEDMKLRIDSLFNEELLELKEKQMLRDKYDTYQLAIKIFLNSNYGAQSGTGTVFAGHIEYFSAAITSTSRIANILVSQAQTKKIMELSGKECKEKRYDHLNYMDCNAQSDTDSCYNSLENVIIKKFGEDYEETQTFERLEEFTLNYIEKIAMPLVRDELDNKYAFTMNAYLPEKLQEDPEVICDNFISVAPKMYLARYKWSEYVNLSKPKLKVTGLSMVRSSTPKFYRKKLEEVMGILIDGDIPKTIDFIEKVREETKTQAPSQICINQGVSSMDYNWDEKAKRFRKWTGEKFLSAPMNSRASLIHNIYLENNKNINGIKDIQAGDKIGFLELKVPNKSSSDVIAFQDERLFNHGLKDYINYDVMFEKGFMKPVHLITDPINWDLTPLDEIIDEEEW